MKRQLGTFAIMAIIALCASVGGFWIGSNVHDEPQFLGDDTVPVREFSPVALTASQEEIFRQFATPLAESEAEYSENIGLTDDEVINRRKSIGSSYDLGEPLSMVDLEFLRIYAQSKGVTQEGTSAESSDLVVAAGYHSSSHEIIPVGSSSATFSLSKTAAGTTASISGYAKMATIDFTFDNSYTVAWTAKRVSGASLTKIVSVADIYAYGAVPEWPFIGLVKQAHPSGSSTMQSYYFGRTGSFTAFVAYMTIDCTSTFNNVNGSFQISAF